MVENTGQLSHDNGKSDYLEATWQGRAANWRQAAVNRAGKERFVLEYRRWGLPEELCYVPLIVYGLPVTRQKAFLRPSVGDRRGPGCRETISVSSKASYAKERAITDMFDSTGLRWTSYSCQPRRL